MSLDPGTTYLVCPEESCRIAFRLEDSPTLTPALASVAFAPAAVACPACLEFLTVASRKISHRQWLALPPERKWGRVTISGPVIPSPNGSTKSSPASADSATSPVPPSSRLCERCEALAPEMWNEFRRRFIDQPLSSPR